jgi:cytochrome c oxidase cbb3-type subunit 3
MSVGPLLIRRILLPVPVVLFFAAFALVHAQERPAGGAGAATAATRLGVSAPADPASVERGATVYASSCGFCHGGDARGATGPDLTRSLYVLNDEDGTVLGDFLKVGRPETGMPPFPGLPAAQLADLAAFLRVRAADGRSRPAMNPASIVVGDPAAGEAYFNGAGGCRTCHSPLGDLKGVGGKYTPVILQGRMINPRVVTGGRRGAPPPKAVPIPVKVTLAPGQVISGTLVSVDDFFVTLIDEAGDRRTIERPIGSDTPKVEITDPLEAHRQLMLKYTDETMHNLVAYLVTLK